MPDAPREQTTGCHFTLSDTRIGPEALVPADLPERYLFEAEVAHGGMGSIVRVHDRQLRRILALKVLHRHYSDNSEVKRRFLEEARVASQLQHPGIAPIHDLGQLADGRPFFTMKLVRGYTLAELLHLRPGPGDDLPRFLNIFEQVCQAVAYAHSLGIIHRDLKPANIMVGTFGEVQVMDWGLAKVLPGATIGAPTQHEEAAPDATTLHFHGTGSEEVTQAGSVLGTPAYMAPEQARGEVSRVDERSDVFGLGALLAQVLTGHPPYEGATHLEIIRQARQGDLAVAQQRLTGCGADPELIALARSCLEAEPERRPRHAGEVVAVIADYQVAIETSRLAAERERTAALVHAEKAQAMAHAERRLRRRNAGLAVAALLVIVVGASAGLSWLRQRDQAIQAAETALAESDALRDQARWSAAHAAARSAEFFLPAFAAPGGLRQRIRAALLDLETAGKLEAIRLARADSMEKDQYSVQPMHRNFEVVFRDYGLEVLTTEAQEVAGRIRASAIRDQLLFALDEWARTLLHSDAKRAGQLLAIASLADPNPWRNAVRHPQTWLQPQLLCQLAERPEALDQPPPCLALLADALGRVAHSPDAAVALLRAAQRKHPEDFWLNHDTAFYLSGLDPPRSAEAAEYYRAALVLRPNSPGVHHNLGRTLCLLGRLDEAELHLRRALELQPDYSYAHNNLGALLADRGQHAEAEQCFLRALDSNPASARAHENLARSLAKRGDLAGAITCFHRLLELEPGHPAAHLEIGMWHRALGQFAQAAAALGEAARRRPGDPLVGNNLGLILSDLGEQRAALHILDAALALDPLDAVLHKNRGLACVRLGRYHEAIRHHLHAVAMRPSDAQAYNNLGAAYWHAGLHPQAIAACEQSIRRDANAADAHYNLALARAAAGQHAGAVAAFRRVVALRPYQADALGHLANLLGNLGRWHEMAMVARKAITLDPDDGLSQMNLGLALLMTDRLAEAEPHLRRAVALLPCSPLAHGNLGVARMRQRRWAEAERHFREAVRLDPRAANTRCDLGTTLLKRGKPHEAAVHLRRATELKPDFVDAYLDLGKALQACADFAASVAALEKGLALVSERERGDFTSVLTLSQQLLDADTRLPAILAGKAEPTGPQQRVILAQLCHNWKRQYAAAARFYAEVIADPRLAGKLPLGFRYDAACAAALAAAGQGSDAAALEEAQRAKLRQHAFAWLSAELAVSRDLARRNSSMRQQIAQRLAFWLRDADLAGVRRVGDLEKLPGRERQAWEKLWTEIRMLAGQKP